MPNQQLLDYINFKTKSGVSNEEIKKLLLESGWKEEDINGAFSYVSANPQIDTTEIPRKTNNSSGKIIFFIISFLLLVGVAFAGYKYVYLPSKILKEGFLEQNKVASSTSKITNSNNSSTTIATSTEQKQWADAWARSSTESGKSIISFSENLRSCKVSKNLVPDGNIDILGLQDNYCRTIQKTYASDIYFNSTTTTKCSYNLAYISDIADYFKKQGETLLSGDFNFTVSFNTASSTDLEKIISDSCTTSMEESAIQN